jgi:hypothetical protein
MRIAWWKWLPFQPWRIVGGTESADEMPEKLPRRGIALVTASGLTKWIVFDCPCRTGHRIMLNADSNRSPYWTLKSLRRLTIFPSIDFRSTRRRCHYSIRDGRVVWAKDSDR